MSKNHQVNVSGPHSSPSSRKEHEGSTGQTTLKYLTLIQRCSAPFLSLYIGIHLAAPIAANFGGSALSTNVMLLGREYYQGKYTEFLLLWIPLGIHIGSSLTRRYLLGRPKRPALVTFTAYAALLSVPIHAAILRILPSSPVPPISSFSPSELDYEFVKVGFSKWPIFTWVGYTTLVGVVLLHAVEGASIVSRYFMGQAPSKRVRRSIAAIASMAVFFGLYRISQEPLQLRGLRLERVLAIYKRSPIHAYIL